MIKGVRGYTAASGLRTGNSRRRGSEDAPDWHAVGRGRESRARGHRQEQTNQGGVGVRHDRERQDMARFRWSGAQAPEHGQAPVGGDVGRGDGRFRGGSFGAPGDRPGVGVAAARVGIGHGIRERRGGRGGCGGADRPNGSGSERAQDVQGFECGRTGRMGRVTRAWRNVPGRGNL